MVVTGTHEGVPAETDSAGVFVRRLPFRHALEQQDAVATLRVRREVAAIKTGFSPDVVHLHFQSGSAFFLLQTLAVSPAPMVVTIHGSLGESSGGESTLLGRLLGTADWVTGVSQAMVAEAVQIEPDVAGRSSVIYNGDSAPIRREPRADPPYLFFSGRHVESKGLDLAIEAMPSILAAHPRARLIIASDGPLRPEFELLVERLGLSEQVEFTGWIDDAQLKDLAARSIAVLVPSRAQEGFGLVALEAALLSRPVIASAIGGLPEVVANGETGIVVQELTAQEIARAAIALLDDPVFADDLGRRGAERAAAKFALPRQLDEFLDLYRRLVK
jgi:glycogen(starch) synthase